MAMRPFAPGRDDALMPVRRCAATDNKAGPNQGRFEPQGVCPKGLYGLFFAWARRCRARIRKLIVPRMNTGIARNRSPLGSSWTLEPAPQSAGPSATRQSDRRRQNTRKSASTRGGVVSGVLSNAQLSARRSRADLCRGRRCSGLSPWHRPRAGEGDAGLRLEQACPEIAPWLPA